MAMIPPSETLKDFANRLERKFTAALNTGSAMDMMILVSETLREMEQPPSERPETPSARMKMSDHCKHAQHRKCESDQCWCACHGGIQLSERMAHRTTETVEEK